MTIYRSLLLLIILLMSACGPEAAPRKSNDTTPTAAPQASPLISTEDAASRSMGDPAAPIVLVEYSDYQ